MMSALSFGFIFNSGKVGDNSQPPDNKMSHMFLNGQANMASLINLALFKLSEEGVLFGYTNIIEKLNEIIYKEFEDQKIVNEWLSKLKESQK
jgi:GTP-sensing pleiotropic transcriptional regulator CodY